MMAPELVGGVIPGVWEELRAIPLSDGDVVMLPGKVAFAINEVLVARYVLSVPYHVSLKGFHHPTTLSVVLRVRLKLEEVEPCILRSDIHEIVSHPGDVYDYPTARVYTTASGYPRVEDLRTFAPWRVAYNRFIVHTEDGQ